MTGEEIQRIREARGLSVREFAEEMGVSNKTIYRWESRPEEEIPKGRAKMARLLVQQAGAA